MTEEEMAEEYADRTRVIDENTRAGTDCISLIQDYEGNYIDIHERIKQAFLAGLKEGKDINVSTKWHDLRKNPNDLPKENITVLLLTEVEPITARYDSKYEAFFRMSDKLDYCIFIAPMSYIAWKEIELPKEIKEK